MKLLEVPSGKTLDWYLNLEEKLAIDVQEEQWFFWCVEPTVIIGRHQVLENEVNVPYCEEHNIRIIRRKSGGGCVYADGGNLMLSCISPSTHSEQVFASFLERVAGALNRLGYPAVTTQHNDILVSGRKVSGTACYTLNTGTIVHATMMWDVNMEDLQKAITPSHEKLNKHGVESVRQRVINLKELNNADINDIKTLQKRLEEEIMVNHQTLPLDSPKSYF